MLGVSFNSMDKENHKISIDRLFTVSVIFGILTSVVKFSFTGFFFILGVTHRFGLQDIGSIIFRSVEFPLDLFHLTLAAFTHVLGGGIMATMLGLLYLLLGKKNHLLKGGSFWVYCMGST